MTMDRNSSNPSMPGDFEESKKQSDQPPPYTARAPRNFGSAVSPAAGPSCLPASASASQAQSTQFGVRPSNYILISKDHGSVTGTFVVDPTIEVPSHALPPLGSPRIPKWLNVSSLLSPREEGSSRPNIILEAKESSVAAEVHVVVSPTFPQEKGTLQTSIKARSKHSSVNLTVHRDPTMKSAVRVQASATHGSVVVNLPRSFEGPLRLSSAYGSITRSPGVLAASRLLYEKNNTQHAFVGNQDAWAANPKDWRGDEAVIESQYASVTVRFSDEPDEWTQLVQGVKGFVSKLLGSK